MKVASVWREGYLRPAVAVNPGEVVATGIGHAETKIVDLASSQGYELLTVGAGRPVCPACADAISRTGATIATPLKVGR